MGFEDQDGFTLIEMLVTLVLTALITTTIMQGLGYLWRLQQRFSEVTAMASVRDEHASWWRDAVHGLLTTQPHTSGQFSATPNIFKGMSLYGLGDVPGVAAPLNCNINNSVRTSVTLMCNHQVLLKLPANSRFVYLDQLWRAHEHWPLAGDPNRQLPEVILIESGQAVIWAASPMNPSAPRIPPQHSTQSSFTP